MKRWKKIVLLLAGLILLSQLPFAYRRYRLGQLSAAIQQLNSQRSAPQSEDAYTDYRGCIHVHSWLGGHSTGSFEELIGAAQSNGLHFVVMTEHPAKDFNTAEMTLQGMHGGVLFLSGSEVTTSTGVDRLLVVPGDGETAPASQPTQDVINREQARGRLSFVAYPQQFRSWEATGYSGIEVYNLYTNAREISYLLMFFDGLWSYGSYPELLFARFYERPARALAKWDEQVLAKKTRLVALAGNDAHSNVGLSLGDAAGKKFLQIKLDPYERSFRIVRNHVLVERDQPLTAETLLTALREGHSYIAFDLFCDATGFTYTAENRVERKLMGDEISVEDGVRLTVSSPVSSRFVLIKDGQRVAEQQQTMRHEFFVNQRGAYRVEVYLDALGAAFRDRPWIISNPVYVR
ncbi:MAG TPA: hypothetical protein VF544_20315 [Pyrinomonadaceae bacterium]|jgi:hypothetical protein